MTNIWKTIFEAIWKTLFTAALILIATAAFGLAPLFLIAGINQRTKTEALPAEVVVVLLACAASLARLPAGRALRSASPSALSNWRT